MPDLYLDIDYCPEKPDDYKIRTNIKEELVGEIIAGWIQDQSGRGKDTRKAVYLDTYHIHMTVDLSYDIFHVTSDTGNDSLTTGIMVDVLSRMNTK